MPLPAHSSSTRAPGASAIMTTKSRVRSLAAGNTIVEPSGTPSTNRWSSRATSLFPLASIDAGTGFLSRTGTISYNIDGRPVPAENNPRRIFERQGAY